MTKFRKSDKITVYAVETSYVWRSCKSPFEYGDIKIYYMDNKRKRVLEEYGMEFKGYTHSWPIRTSSRSIADLERKYYADYEKVKHILGDIKIQVTKLGEL